MKIGPVHVHRAEGAARHLSPLAGRGRRTQWPNDFKTDRARLLWQNSTNAERRLSYRLRSRSIDGHKFVRQEPIGPYDADFICRERRLIVEVDGGQHADNPHDTLRDKWLVERGYRIVRIWNNDVIKNIEGVLEEIARALDGESSPHPDR